MAGITQHTQGASQGPGPCLALESPHLVPKRRLLRPSQGLFQLAMVASGWHSPGAGLRRFQGQAAGPNPACVCSKPHFTSPYPWGPHSQTSRLRTKAEPGPSQTLQAGQVHVPHTPSELVVCFQTLGQGHVPFELPENSVPFYPPSYRLPRVRAVGCGLSHLPTLGGRVGPAQVVEGGHSCPLDAPGPLVPALSWELWTHPDSPEAWLVFQGPPGGYIPSKGLQRSLSQPSLTGDRPERARPVHMPKTGGSCRPPYWPNVESRAAREVPGHLGQGGWSRGLSASSSLAACRPARLVFTCSLRLGWALRP